MLKNLFLSKLILCFIVLQCLALAQNSFAAKKAILVGIENYGSRSGFGPLSYTVDDVEKISEVLNARGYDIIKEKISDTHILKLNID